jgi:hypothetical protein
MLKGIVKLLIKNSSRTLNVIFIILLAAAVIVGLDFLVLKQTDSQTTNKVVLVPTKKQMVSHSMKQTIVSGAYASWKTYCVSSLSACIHYPPTWLVDSSSAGVLENASATNYVSLISWNNQNGTPNDAYIYSVNSLETSISDLDIVGYIVSDQPGYVVYDASYVAAHDMRVGTTEDIIDGNYAFMGKDASTSLIATPYGSAYTSIQDFDQAKAWFTGSDGQLDLKILQSLYYQ